MRGLNPGLAAGKEKLLKSGVPEGLDHCFNVARGASRVKASRSMRTLAHICRLVEVGREGEDEQGEADEDGDGSDGFREVE